MEKTELLEKINSFPYWHYPFSLRDGVVIHPTNKENAREKIELRDFIWPVVMAVKGGSLKGLRVLDVGCNEGFWSLEAHKSGAAYVLGVDARAQHVEQAQLVRDALGIDPSHLEYRQMDVTVVQVKPPRRPLDHSYFVGKRAVFTARACAEGERADLSYQLRE